MWDWGTIAVVAAIYLGAGGVKGLLGFGLPAFAVGLAAAVIGLTEALALVIVPALTTNVWQALTGPELGALARRLWPYLATTVLATWLATGVHVGGDPVALAGGLGALMIVYASLTLAGIRPPPPGDNERWVGPLVGLANGFVTGLVGIYVLITGPWLQALGFSRDSTVQALGLVFTVCTLALGVSLASRSLMTPELAWMSAAAVAPTFAGVWAGQALRHRLSEALFRRVFLVALAVLGVYLLARAVVV